MLDVAAFRVFGTKKFPARGQVIKTRDTGDARQSFAPKSQRGDCLKISSRPDLTGRMPLQRKQRIVAVHSTAVVDDANQRNSAATSDDVDFPCTGVDAVFDQFLYH